MDETLKELDNSPLVIALCSVESFLARFPIESLQFMASALAFF